MPRLKKLTESESSLKLSLNKIQTDFKASQKELSKNQSQNVNNRSEKELKEKQDLTDEIAALRAQLEEVELEYQNSTHELRQALTKTQDQFSAREEELQNEINEWQLHYTTRASNQSSGEDTPPMNSDLDSAIEAATQPILSRVKSLQSTTSRLKHQLKLSERKLRDQNENNESKILELIQKLKDNSTELSEKNELIHSLQQRNTEFSDMTDTLNKQLEQVNTSKQAQENQIKILKSDICDLNLSHLQELEKLRKFYEFNNNYQKKFEQDTSSPTSVCHSIDLQDSSKFSASQNRPRSHSIAFEKLVYKNQNERICPNPALCSEDLLNSSSTSLVEKPEEITSDSKLYSLQVQLQSALEAKEHLSSELIRVNLKLKATELEFRRLENSEAEYKDFSSKYETVLVLLGEKEEKLNELTSDIQEMKAEYKVQISELVTKISQLQSKKG